MLVLKNIFEDTVKNCVNISITLKKITYHRLSRLTRSIADASMDHLILILKNYYIDVFRPADKEFGKLVLERGLTMACIEISHGVVERCINDKLHGEFNKFI